MFNALKRHRKIGIRCYDNGSKTADRYTVLYTGRYTHLTASEFMYVGMSENPFHPQGVGITGFSLNHIDNRGYGQKGGYGHLGRIITFDALPEKCQKLVMRDVFELAYV